MLVKLNFIATRNTRR